jgi:hypothetical protein
LSGTSANVLGEGPIANGKGSWLASVRRSYLDYLIKRIDPETGFAFGFVDAQGKAVYDFSPRHQVSITALLGRAVFEEGDPELDVNDIQTGISRAWLSSLSWRYLPSPRWAVTQRLYSTGLHFDNENNAGAALDAARFTNLGWRADGSVTAATRAVVEFGGDVEHLGGRSRIVREISATSGLVALSDYDQEATAGSAYAQVRLGVHPRVSVIPGGRIDHWSLTGSTAASPWVNAECVCRRGPRLRGGSGIYRQFPDLDQVFGIHGGGRDLRPERALHLDAGIEQALFRQARVLFNVYSRQERDVLWTPGAEPRLSSTGTFRPGSFNAPWDNVLRGEARGAEVVVRRDAADGFSGFAGYAFSRLKYTDTGTGESFWGMRISGTRCRCTATIASRADQCQRPLPIRVELSDHRVHWRTVGRPGHPPLIDRQPLFYGLSTERNSLRPAGLLTSGRPRRPRVHLGEAAGWWCSSMSPMS